MLVQFLHHTNPDESRANLQTLAQFELESAPNLDGVIIDGTNYQVKQKLMRITDNKIVCMSYILEKM